MSILLTIACIHLGTTPFKNPIQDYANSCSMHFAWKSLPTFFQDSALDLSPTEATILWSKTVRKPTI